ncbi:MAG: OmpA family protein [Coriobacteriia bacterium]|nr:OmpA family protein [Coriobacteriia bacterium]
MSSDVLFYGDSSQFKTDPKTNGDVKDIVYSMNADSALVVTITGYTANYQTNAEGGNESLAKNRAEAMKRVLVELGISEDRIVTEGVGKG